MISYIAIVELRMHDELSPIFNFAERVRPAQCTEGGRGRLPGESPQRSAGQRLTVYTCTVCTVQVYSQH